MFVGETVINAVRVVVFERVGVLVCVRVAEGLAVQEGVIVSDAVMLGLAVIEDVIVLEGLCVLEGVLKAVLERVGLEETLGVIVVEVVSEVDLVIKGLPVLVNVFVMV